MTTSTQLGDGAAGSGKQAAASVQHAKDEPCSDADTRSCTKGNPSRQPLQCVDGAWREQPACNENQRCETAAGPDQGSCVRIARECIAQVPDEPFCAERDIRMCSGGVPSDVRSCGQDQHCVMKDDTASCECTLGKVEVAGQCQIVQDCMDQNGGCDALTECIMSGKTRVCGACKAGFSGDGMVGCTPLLTSLVPSGATLSPLLSDGVRSYRIHLPLFLPQLTLTPTAADGVEININGSNVSAGTSWTSDKLSMGEHPLAITLNASNGLTSRYEILVEHTGAQEAFLSAKHPDRDDAFGCSLALSGETLVVGAHHDDSASPGIDGDETSNAVADSGAAYVFVRTGKDWAQQAYLKSDNPRPGYHFGGAVALEGDLLLVSELGDDPFPLNGDNTAKQPGSIHVFMRTGSKWTRVTKIASPSSSSDLFGYAFALGKDQIIIGAPFDTANGRNAGAIYSLPRDGNWGPLTKYTLKNGQADDMFGWKLALEGDSLLVGAPEKSPAAQRQGKVAYFTRSGDDWQEQQILTAPNREDGACFGWSVALSGDNAAIGSPFPESYSVTPRGHAFVYQRSAGKWEVQKQMDAAVPRDSDYFGCWVSFPGANTLLVNSSGDASGSHGLDADPTQGVLVQSGAFYVFNRQDDDWVRTSFAKPDDPHANEWMGQQSAMSGDTIAVSASNASISGVSAGGVYVFR